MVEKAWNTTCHFSRSIDRWQFKVRSLRRIIRGWAANEIAVMNRTKSELLEKFNRLESLAETGDLPDKEFRELKDVERDLECIWSLEEIKVRQRSRERNLLEGDRNTAYFQAIANQRNRKKRIDCLQGPVGLVFDQKGMMKVAVDFYKSLFCKRRR